jgi:hypothetical protein
MENKINIILETGDVSPEALYAGDPLVLHVSISNPFTLEDEYHNKSLDMDIQRLEEQLGRGEIEEDNFEKERERLTSEKIKVEYPTIGSTGDPWHRKIVLIDDETNLPLKWGLKPSYNYPDQPFVELRSENQANVTFILEPEIVQKLPEARYVIKAIFNDVESNTVEITVNKREEEEPSESKLYRNTVFMLEMGAVERSLYYINEILRRDPHSINGHMLTGRYYEAKNDVKAALESYLQARKEFELKYPDSYEPPDFIDTRINALSIRKKN